MFFDRGLILAEWGAFLLLVLAYRAPGSTISSRFVSNSYCWALAVLLICCLWFIVEFVQFLLSICMYVLPLIPTAARSDSDSL